MRSTPAASSAGDLVAEPGEVGRQHATGRSRSGRAISGDGSGAPAVLDGRSLDALVELIAEPLRRSWRRRRRLGHADGRVVFVERRAPGRDGAGRGHRAKRDFARGHVVAIVEPRRHRVRPPCPSSSRAGAAAAVGSTSTPRRTAATWKTGSRRPTRSAHRQAARRRRAASAPRRPVGVPHHLRLAWPRTAGWSRRVPVPSSSRRGRRARLPRRAPAARRAMLPDLAAAAPEASCRCVSVARPARSAALAGAGGARLAGCPTDARSGRTARRCTRSSPA